MMNISILKSVFEKYDIKKIILVVEDNTYNFILYNMNSSISLEKWEFLENILNDMLDKNVNILTYNQCLKYLGDEYIKKGVVIK